MFITVKKKQILICLINYTIIRSSQDCYILWFSPFRRTCSIPNYVPYVCVLSVSRTWTAYWKVGGQSLNCTRDYFKRKLHLSGTTPMYHVHSYLLARYRSVFTLIFRLLRTLTNRVLQTQCLNNRV